MNSFFLQSIALQPAWFEYDEFPAGSGIGNLADPQPKMVWTAPTESFAWTRRFDIDLQADYVFDTIALLFHNVPADAQWAIYARPAVSGPAGPAPTHLGEDEAFEFQPFALMRSDPTIHSLRYHSVSAAGTTWFARYIRIVIYLPTGGPPWQAGNLLIGDRLEPGAALGLSGIDWGMGRRIEDLSDVRILDGGERGRWLKAKVPEVRGSFSHLSDAELRHWWAMLSAAGESGPILFVEDPGQGTGQQERIHYGTLSGLDFYERRQADKSRIEFRLTHWL